MRRPALVLALLGLLAAPGIAFACLWDTDTRIEEERGLPSLKDAILGRYEVHSKEYYLERRDRLEKKRPTLSPDEQDDLAVAYERLADHEKAIALMVAKESADPGRYTTYANWGTFLAHSGKLEDGLEKLEKAVAINPDAHFGRERYQIAAIQFLIQAKKDPAFAKASTILGPSLEPAIGVRDEKGELRQRHLLPSKFFAQHPSIREDVWSGIVGMLVLGGNPAAGWHEFYYSLGELCCAVDWDYVEGKGKTLGDNRGIAWMAFERAREAGSPRLEAIAAYQKLLDREGTYAADYATARREATRWVEAYQTREREILAASQDPRQESLWTAFYAKEGRPDRLGFPRAARFYELSEKTQAIAIVALVGFGLIALLRMRDRRRRRAAA